MPDEIGWPTPADEAKLDEARAEANRESPQSAADRVEVDRRCEAARLYRERRAKEKTDADQTESR